MLDQFAEALHAKSVVMDAVRPSLMEELHKTSVVPILTELTRI